MSSTDATGRAGPTPGSAAYAISLRAGSRPPTSRQESSRAEQVLDKVAAKAMEYPPQSIAALSASAVKFLLTDLEPALELARQIRWLAADGRGPIVEILARDRRSEAMDLLTAPPGEAAA